MKQNALKSKLQSAKTKPFLVGSLVLYKKVQTLIVCILFINFINYLQWNAFTFYCVSCYNSFLDLFQCLVCVSSVLSSPSLLFLDLCVCNPAPPLPLTAYTQTPPPQIMTCQSCVAWREKKKQLTGRSWLWWFSSKSHLWHIFFLIDTSLDYKTKLCDFPSALGTLQSVGHMGLECWYKSYQCTVCKYRCKSVRPAVKFSGTWQTLKTYIQSQVLRFY